MDLGARLALVAAAIVLLGTAAAALLGWALLSNHLVSYLIFGLWLPVLWATVLLEERELRDRFGAEWDA